MNYMQRLDKLITLELFNEIMGVNAECIYVDSMDGEYFIVYGKVKKVNIDSFCFKCIDWMLGEYDFQVTIAFDSLDGLVHLELYRSFEKVAQWKYTHGKQEAIIKSALWVKDNQ